LTSEKRGRDGLVRPIVYLDLWFAANVLIDGLLLWAASRLAARRVSWGRLAAAATVGGLYSLSVFLPGLTPLVGGPGVLLLSLVMVAVLCWPCSAAVFGRVLAFMYVVACLAGGAALALGGTGPLGGAVWGTPTASLVRFGWAGMIIGCSGALALNARRWLNRGMLSGITDVTLEIWFDGRVTRVMGLLDTGNRLRDPFTQGPVIVVEAGALAGALPGGIQQSVVSPAQLTAAVAGLSESPESAAWLRRLRLIPFRTVGRSDGLLVGLRPDRIVVDQAGTRLEAAGAVVAVHDGPLCPGGSFRALVPVDLLWQALDGPERGRRLVS